MDGPSGIELQFIGILRHREVEKALNAGAISAREILISDLHARTQPEDAKDVEEANVYCGASSGHVLDGEVEHESTCGCVEI